MAVVIVTSTSNRATQNVYQLNNGIVVPTHKYFSLEANKLDGTYHCIDAEGLVEVGWWGAQLSDAQGNLPKQTILLTGSVTVSQLRLIGDSVLGEFPVDFKIELYKNNVLLHTETVVNNTNVFWTKTLNSTYLIDNMLITISKINKAHRVVKILETGEPAIPKRLSMIKNWSFRMDFRPNISCQTDSKDICYIKSSDTAKVQTNTFKQDDTLKFQLIASDNIVNEQPIVLNSNNINYGSGNIYQLLNGIEIPSYKYFSLAKNILDGTFHPIELGDNIEVGWWGNSISDAQGRLSNQTITLTGLRLVDKLRLVGDSELNEFPVAFTIQLYFQNRLLYTETVNNNNNVIWEKTLAQNYKIDRQVITVTKINTPNNNLKLLEIANPIVPLNYLAADRPKISISEDTNIISYIQSSERINLQLIDRVNITQNTFTRTDSTKINLTFAPNLKNVHTLMSAATRQVFGKVTITYADPFINTDVKIQSSEIGRGTSTQGIADNILTSEYKWASLHDNVLDGSYHPMPKVQDTIWHAGLWGTTLSNAQGIITPSVRIEVTFASRPIYYFKLSGDDKLQNFPVNFTVNVYDINNQNIYTETVNNNAQSLWYKVLPQAIQNATKIELIVTKISKPNQVVKITEFFNSISETYLGNQIVDLHLLEELDYIDSSVTLGAISSNEIDITLDNTTDKFNIYNKHSPIYGLLTKNRKVEAWLGVELTEDVMDWYSLGVFWTTKWNVPDKSLIASVTARDRLDLLNYSDFTTSLIYENKSLAELFKIVLSDAGITSIDYSISDDLQNIIIPYAWFDRMSHREALQRLAACALIHLYCDRQGKIVITPMQPTKDTYFTFKDSDNVITKDYPFVWNDITNYVSVASNIYGPGNSEVVLEVQETITLAGNTSEEFIFNYKNVPIYSIDYPVLAGDAYITVADYTSYAWGIRITLKNNDSQPHSISKLTVSGRPLAKQSSSINIAKDDASVNSDGLIKTVVDQELIQNTQYAKQLAAGLLDNYKDSRYDIALNCRGNIGVFLGQKVNIEDYKTLKSEPYVIKRQTLDWNGAFRANIECRKL